MLKHIIRLYKVCSFSEYSIPKVMPRSQPLLLGMVLTAAAVNSITMGYDTMMMSSLIAIPQFTDYFDLNPTTIGLINASVWMGAIISCPFMQWMADTLGRKNTVFMASAFSFVGVALQTASTRNIGMFIVARIVLGFCTQLTGAASPLIVAEVAPTQRRGFLVGMYFTCYNAGAIIATGITYRSVDIHGTWAWRLPSIIQGLPSLMSILLLFFIPESPRWMIMKGANETAKEVFKVSHNVDDSGADALVEEIQIKLEEEKESSRGPWKTLFYKPSKPDVRRLIIVFTLALVVEMAGSSVVSYYITIILQQAGITSPATLLEVNLISSCWNFVVSIAGSFTFDYLGRKLQAIGAIIGMIISFVLLGVFVKIFGPSTNTSGQYATIFLMFLFNTFYSFGFNPLSSLYPSEIFPMKTRAAGTTFYQFWNNGFGLVATFILPIAMDNITWKFYIVNAGYDVAFLISILIFWVETNGVELEEVGRLLGEAPEISSLSEEGSVEEVQETVVLKKE